MTQKYTPPPCPHCGAAQENCGPPIGEDYCTNPACTGMRDAMFANMRERVRKDRALREAAPDLLAAIHRYLAARKALDAAPTHNGHAFDAAMIEHDAALANLETLARGNPA